MPLRRYYEDSKREKGLKKSKMLVGGQAKLDKNKNNKIDAQDFKILKAEKAKGRGQGLQDEKMKPGKPMKAALGAIALGLGAKKMMDKNKMKMPMGMGAAAAIDAKKKEILGKKRGGFSAAQKRKYPGLAKAGSVSEFLKRRKELSGKGKMSFSDKMKAQDQGLINKKTGAGAKDLMKRAASVTLGKRLLLPVAAGVATVQYLKKKMKEKKENKKMGGGMMQRPMAYAEGGPASDEKKRRAPRGQQATRGLSGGVGALGKGKTPSISQKKPKILISLGGSYEKSRKEVEAEGGSPRLKTEDDKAGRILNKMYGNVRGRDKYSFQSGGMMKPMGYKAGKSVKAKCKLGRNKPTKMY